MVDKIKEKQDLILVCLLGLIYGGIFYPIYNEFYEFGQTLSGKVSFSSFNSFYKYRDTAPSLLYVLAKIVAQLFSNVALVNVIVSAFISMLCFGSVFVFSKKMLPNSKLLVFIPLGITSIFFPNFFLYPLWFPNYFFIWGQIGFYLFLGMISLSVNQTWKQSGLVFFVTMCHPVYGAIGTCYYIFEKFFLKELKIKNLSLLIISFILATSIITSDFTSNYLNKDRKEISTEVNLKDNNQTNSLVIPNSKVDLSNIHSPLFHGNEKSFLIGILSIIALPIIIFYIIKQNKNVSKNLICLNYFLIIILCLCLLASISSYFIVDQFYFNKILALIDKSAPNRVLNCYFLICIILFLKYIESRNVFLKNKVKIFFIFSILFLFLVPVPLYILPYFWVKPYPSIIELALLCTLCLVLLIYFSRFFFKFNFDIQFIELLINKITTNPKKTAVILFIMIDIGSFTLRMYDFGIGPKYFASIHDHKNIIINEMKNLPKKGGVLVNYGVHGVRGMNVQQISGVEYILPFRSLPKYFFKGNLLSVGCYEKASNINWNNVRNKMKRCFENKTKLEWKLIFKKLNISAVLVPSSHKLKLKLKNSDNFFSLYVIK